MSEALSLAMTIAKSLGRGCLKIESVKARAA
jgi:hypothetical protein